MTEHNAALVFQHGGTPETARLAHALATVAYQMNNENKAAKWRSAASWDRLMMTLKRPQWYATQFTKPHGSDKFVLYDIDETVVSDETRKSMGARSVAEARAHAEELSKQ